MTINQWWWMTKTGSLIRRAVPLWAERCRGPWCHGSGFHVESKQLHQGKSIFKNKGNYQLAMTGSSTIMQSNRQQASSGNSKQAAHGCRMTWSGCPHCSSCGRAARNRVRRWQIDLTMTINGSDRKQTGHTKLHRAMAATWYECQQQDPEIAFSVTWPISISFLYKGVFTIWANGDFAIWVDVWIA